MPARSDRQRRLMHAALQHRQGTRRSDSPTVRRVAESMRLADLREYAARQETPQERKARIKRVLAMKKSRGE